MFKFSICSTTFDTWHYASITDACDDLAFCYCLWIYYGFFFLDDALYSLFFTPGSGGIWYIWLSRLHCWLASFMLCSIFRLCFFATILIGSVRQSSRYFFIHVAQAHSNRWSVWFLIGPSLWIFCFIETREIIDWAKYDLSEFSAFWFFACAIHLNVMGNRGSFDEKDMGYYCSFGEVLRASVWGFDEGVWGFSSVFNGWDTTAVQLFLIFKLLLITFHSIIGMRKKGEEYETRGEKYVGV